ncbi:hypothetical protein CWB73_20090 [Pseudoalteromonas phenolica]|uniref:Outer membrane protein beta-barrel domain-containing protein n=2 Tax=Pseudoalteromonas phenolica TaxID=161398 RepID=A0A5S3YP76_9GAMM|nr:hypothetical protein CWB73_20090 [Pseudoalteromonas phenolica]
MLSNIKGIKMLRLAALSLFISSAAFAGDNSHSVGLGYSYSNIDNINDESTSELNDLVTSHFSFSYHYNVNKYFSVGVGHLNGDSSKADGGFIDVFTDSKIDYNSNFLSAIISYPITKRSSLYFKANALSYEYDIIDDNKSVYKEDDSDFGYGLGWKYVFDNGIGLDFGYEVLNLGSRIDIEGFSAGISYNF